MKGREHERGATLIMIIGVIAVLIILTSSMVALAGNVQKNTSRDRQQTTAFNVAEAGMDAAQSALWVKWPSVTNYTAGYRPAVASSLAGGTVSVKFYDDDGNLALPGIRRTVPCR